MYYIKQVNIENFWSNKIVNIVFQNDVNFLIGVNGSGKTTIINIIVAALYVNISDLKKNDFNRIILILEDQNKGSTITLEINKATAGIYASSIITYSIGQLDSGEREFYNFGDFPTIEGTLVHDYSMGAYSSTSSEYLLRAKIQGYLNISWLSINRSTHLINNNINRESIESSVDLKLNDLSNRFIKYFSFLENRFSSAQTMAQKEHLPNLFDYHITEEKLISVTSKNEFINLLKSEKISINFPENYLSNNEIYEMLYDQYMSARDRIYNRNYETIFDDISTILRFQYLEKIHNYNNSIENASKDIFRFRDLFINIINNLYKRKELKIKKDNTLEIITPSDKSLTLFDLSSGEKQLLIILGECMLQESKPHVYIADEPELSLHIEWQERLVKSLIEINPNSQIIFATHSPDIVSSYSDSVIHIENCIHDEGSSEAIY
ncbi:AAA family ATPase [Larkinella sp. VNQ87]|uniref:AAA family ATPase n=1 Tax=Larkinella sp. VNQ87 TaxID=3400921 RepID=UPI003C05FA03